MDKLGKKYCKKDIIRAVEILDKAGIEIQIPFMYGLPGETMETMEETYQFAKELLKRYKNVKSVLAGHLLPLIGTEMFDRLKDNPGVNAEYPGNLSKDDSFDYQKLVELQTKYFSNVTLEKVDECITKTRELINEEGNTGSFGYVNK